MKINKHFLILFFKGMLIGTGAIIPGLSGGTMAVITNTFESIIDAISNIFHQFKQSFFTLAPVSFGAIIALMILSLPIKLLIVNFPLAAKTLFVFITLLSTCLFAKRSIDFNFTIPKIVSLTFGILVSVLISSVTEYTNLIDFSDNYPALILVGFPLAVSLVLPGISFSYMLLFFGLYEKTLTAIHNFDFKFIFVIISSVALGSFIFSKCLVKLIEKQKQETYSFVLGFVINSTIDMLFKQVY